MGEVVRSSKDLPATIMRLPKVYGPEDNGDLATVYGFRHAPSWRWTHGHVENVAKAIALAVCDVRARGRTYNVGEPYTPTMQERLRFLPERPTAAGDVAMHYRFEQNVDYDTSRIRTELDFVEDLDEGTAMRETAPGGESLPVKTRR